MKKILLLILLISLLISVIAIKDWSQIEQIHENKSIGPNFLEISSIPTGANIYIDDEFRGIAYKIIEIPRGVHILKMNLTGYKDIYFEVDVKESNIKIDAFLEPKNKYSNVIIFD